MTFCPINTSFITSTSAYNTTLAYVNHAADFAGQARDGALNLANEHLPESAASTLSTVANTIKNSTIAASITETLATYGATPVIAGTALCGIAGGYLLSGAKLISKRNALALITVATGVLLTSNKTDLAILAGTTIASAGAHALAKRVGLMK